MGQWKDKKEKPRELKLLEGVLTFKILLFTYLLSVIIVTKLIDISRDNLIYRTGEQLYNSYNQEVNEKTSFYKLLLSLTILLLLTGLTIFCIEKRQFWTVMAIIILGLLIELGQGPTYLSVLTGLIILMWGSKQTRDFLRLNHR